MRGAVLVAITAAIGNMLQGVDNAMIAAAVMYIKREFHLETQPAVKGLVVATSLIGATIITTFSGPVTDMVGRRPMLIASSLLYFVGGLIMLWSPNVRAPHRPPRRRLWRRPRRHARPRLHLGDGTAGDPGPAQHLPAVHGFPRHVHSIISSCNTGCKDPQPCWVLMLEASKASLCTSGTTIMEV